MQIKSDPVTLLPQIPTSQTSLSSRPLLLLSLFLLILQHEPQNTVLQGLQALPEADRVEPLFPRQKGGQRLTVFAIAGLSPWVALPDHAEPHPGRMISQQSDHANLTILVSPDLNILSQSQTAMGDSPSTVPIFSCENMVTISHMLPLSNPRIS